MRRRARFWTTALALLLWQLGGVPLAPAAGAAAREHVTAGEAAHEGCAGHHQDSQASAVQKSAGDHASVPHAAQTKHPCCGSPGCKCQGPPPGLALIYAASPTMPSHPPAPLAVLDAGHLSCDPSDPFRPPIV